jgi:ribosomal protein S18 acetylase RimI-like enzyme
MTDISIHLAQLSHIPALLPLMEQLGYPSSQKELEARFERFIKNEGYGVAVACLGPQIIGMIAWSRSSLFVSDKTRFHIEGLVVDNCHQGSGVGRKLMLFVEEIGRQCSPAIIDLTSGLRRAKGGSHEFYKNLGYTNEGPTAKLYLRKEV